MQNPIRVTVDHDGNMTEEQLMSAGRTVSSTEYQAQGTLVRKGIASRTVADQSQIADDETLVVDGMEMTAAMARELGLIGVVADEGLSVGAAASAAQAAQAAEATPETVEKANTGNPQMDAVTDALNDRLDEGNIAYEEASTYEAVVGSVVMSGMDLEEAVGTLDGLADGTVDAHELPSETKSVLANAEAQVTDAATKSAQAELGAEGYNRIAEIAAVSPEVNEALRGYAIQRALGRTDATWADFLADVESHVRGGR